MRRGPVDWSFDGTWPFESRWFDCGEGRMHYVDQGPRAGRPVVLVHGNPTWGYLFRHFIAALAAAGNRAIVPDHLGFGRSDKPSGPALYGVEHHARRLESLLESLDLEGAVVVPHDWGGPIGLAWATRHHQRVDGLFILNTVAHDFGRMTSATGLARPLVPLPLRLLRAPGIGELLVQGLDAFKPLMFGIAIEHRERLNETVRRAYRQVHAGWAERAGMLAFARQLPARPGGPADGFNARIEPLLRTHFRAKPVQIVWGMKDRVLPPGYVDDLWLDTFPEAAVLRIADAGHFVQEDAHERVVPSLIAFLRAL